MKGFIYILIVSLAIVGCKSVKIENSVDCSVFNMQSLSSIKDSLNKKIPEYKHYNRKLFGYYGFKTKHSFYIKKGKPMGFFVYDLVDTTNNSTISDCVEFIDGHIYHFAPINKKFNYSNILVLKDRKASFFYFINKEGRGNSINEVIEYIEQFYKDETVSRVKNYRMYSSFLVL